MSKYYKDVDVIKTIGLQDNLADATKDTICDAIVLLPSIEVSEDCVDRYSVLAELDPRSFEYKAVKELPSAIPTAKQSCETCANIYCYQDAYYCDEIGKKRKLNLIIIAISGSQERASG